jgi:rhodanese-related sulfurtransferase
VTRAWRRWLAGAAALAGALAPLAGGPSGRAGSAARPAAGSGALERSETAGGAPRGIDERSESGGRGPDGSAGGEGDPPLSIDVAELARIVADQEDHVSAIELARWIRARRSGLRVIDVRTASEFRIFHLPGAEHIALEGLADTRFGPDETIVLYSEVGIHGGQAWVFLRALGHRRVFFLRGGLHEWLDDVMSPAIAADAPPEALAAFAEIAELSRWFGGTPRWIDRGAPASDDARLARGRGC